jgi:nucleoside-diphosphate-sugar epimerase
MNVVGGMSFNRSVLPILGRVYSVEDRTADARVNILGSLQLLEECRRAGAAEVIFASTGDAMYGETDIIPTPEEFPAWPVSPYGVAKLSVEHYLHYYRHQFGLRSTVRRYANVGGPRQNPHGEAGGRSFRSASSLASPPSSPETGSRRASAVGLLCCVLWTRQEPRRFSGWECESGADR